jgi:hypothetical protein
MFPLGSTPVTCTATNNKGNSSSCTFNVVVVDTTPPEITTGDMIKIWPANKQYRKFKLSDLVTAVEDLVDGPLDIDEAGSIISIYCDEPEDSKDKRNNHNERDIVILSDCSFKVLADRDRNGNGRVYGVTFEVFDEAGNVSEATCYIGVPRKADQIPVDDGPDAGYTVYPDNDWFHWWWRHWHSGSMFRWHKK